MRVLLVHPRMGGRDGVRSVRTWEMQPLWAAVLAACTPADVEVVLQDDRLEDVDFDTDVDLVGINVETFTARRAYEISERFRSRGIPVVLGGFHATLVPDEAQQHADAVVIGEGEGAWPRLLADAAAGRLERRYEVSDFPSLDGLRTDRSIFADKRYLPLELVETGRGCPFSCEFCSVTAFFKGRYRRRPTAEVITELEALPRKRVFFVDDNVIGGGGEGAKEFFSAIRPLGLSWVSQGSLDAAKDEELLGMMRDSGCACLLVGIESLDERNLSAMGKAVNSGGRDYDPLIDTMRRYRIPLYCTMLVGYDRDTEHTTDDLLRFAERHKLFMAAFNHVTPFPGTPLYERLRAEGRLTHESWWLDPSYRYGDLPFEPVGASRVALQNACQAKRKRFYGPASIARRAFDPTNGGSIVRLMTFLAANLSVMRDVRRREGVRLGEQAAMASLTPDVAGDSS